MLSGTMRGLILLTGGPFGVEASVLAVMVSLCASAVLLYAAWRKGRIVPPPGRNETTPHDGSVRRDDAAPGPFGPGAGGL
jgi:CAAX protease family protein